MHILSAILLTLLMVSVLIFVPYFIGYDKEAVESGMEKYIVFWIMGAIVVFLIILVITSLFLLSCHIVGII